MRLRQAHAMLETTLHLEVMTFEGSEEGFDCEQPFDHDEPDRATTAVDDVLTDWIEFEAGTVYHVELHPGPGEFRITAVLTTEDSSGVKRELLRAARLVVLEDPREVSTWRQGVGSGLAEEIARAVRWHRAESAS